MTFQRPATNRQLTFHEIADETQLPNNEVGKFKKKKIDFYPQRIETVSLFHKKSYT